LNITTKAIRPLRAAARQPVGDGVQTTEFEIGGQYKLIKPLGDGFAFAFRTMYEVVKDAPDEILFGPLGSCPR
jgi:hypothetical protein